MRLENILATILVGVAVAVTLFTLIRACENLAWGEEGNAQCQVSNAIQRLNPFHTPERATMMAQIFVDEAKVYDIDPLLLVAISRKESNILPWAVGQRGEIGLMQVWGAAYHQRPGRCDIDRMFCQVRTGAAWLALARRQCGADRSDYLFAYGVGRCPRSHEEATKHRSVRRARMFYERIGGEW